MPRPTQPSHVAAGEIVDASWGNQVADAIDYNYTWMVRSSVTYQGGLLLQGDSQVKTSAADGAVTVTFPIAFAAPPVVFCNFAQADYAYVTNVFSIAPTGFTYILVNPAAGIVPNSTHTVQWGAFGPRLT